MGTRRGAEAAAQTCSPQPILVMVSGFLGCYDVVVVCVLCTYVRTYRVCLYSDMIYLTNLTCTLPQGQGYDKNRV